jgi:hypothetical protein
MKTYMVPCFVIVSADSADEAIAQVEELQTSVRTPDFLLYQDEGMPPKEVPAEDEYHSIRDYYTYEELITGELD